MSTSSFDRSAVLAACKQYGTQLNVDPSLDGPRLMWAIAGNESSYGVNCGPRHEPAYDVGGSIYKNNTTQQKLVDDFGAPAACSYGPWQMMFINFAGSNPGQLLSDLDRCAREFVRFFNVYVVGLRKAVTLSDVGQVWNAGHVSDTPSPGVLRYVQSLQHNYDNASEV